MGYPGDVPADGAPATTPVWEWLGHVQDGHEDVHEAFVEWLRGPEAAEIMRRRRLVSYSLCQEGRQLTVRLETPPRDDPRVVIDFLRYPGMWPPFWEFERGGPAAPTPGAACPSGDERIRWRRDREG